MASRFEGDLNRFNERFYEGDPAAYVQTRLDQWMAAAERAGAFAAVRVRSEKDPSLGDNSLVESEALSFLTADAVVLHHHAAETVVRYYLAHLNDHPVPWTEIAGRRNGGFKDLVREKLIDREPERDEVAAIVYGLPAPQPFDNDKEWGSAVDGVIEFLVEYAHTHIDGAPMYNSLKHGLGASVGRTDVVLVEELDEPTRPTVTEIQTGRRLGSGPRVEYPTYPKRKKTEKFTDWSIVTEWVDVERSIRLIQIAVGMLGSIRHTGRRRRGVAGNSDGLPVAFFTPGLFRPSNMHSPGRLPGHTMSQMLLREAKQ